MGGRNMKILRFICLFITGKLVAVNLNEHD